MARVWIQQWARDKKTLGAKAPWYVCWYTDVGKQKSQKIGGKLAARKKKSEIENDLNRGLTIVCDKIEWSTFRTEFEEKVLASLEPNSQKAYQDAMNCFERVLGPRYIQNLTTKAFDEFRTKRSAEQSRRHPGKKVSPASVNKDLRHLKRIVRKAKQWGYLAKLPDIEFAREPEKLPTRVSQEDFALLYAGCGNARRPAEQPYTPEEWWKAIFVFCYLTGWRIGEVLLLRWDEVDLEAGTALTLAENNKGKRDDLVRLHPIVVDHLHTIRGFTPEVFYWPHHRRTLDVELSRVQVGAGVVKTVNGEERGKYGWHDFRRAYATENADTFMGLNELQSQMRHRSYATTKRYIAMAEKFRAKPVQQFVPDALQKRSS